MRLGLGTGSTAAAFVAALGQRVQGGFQVLCVPTSEVTRNQAAQLGIPLSTLDETPELDLTIDGADEIGPGLSLIKGGGAALLREKIVASASREFLVIADHSKIVPVLGRFPLPVEIVSFGASSTIMAIEAIVRRLGLSGPCTVRRRDGATIITDGGNLIVDCALEAIPDPAALASALSFVPGVVEHGFFLGMATRAVVAGRNGIDILFPQSEVRS